MRMLSLLFLIFLAPSVISAKSYVVEEMRDEGATDPRPFSITRVEPFSGGLRLYITTDNIAQVAQLLNSGRLTAQFSAGESESAVRLSLGKTVRCDEGTFHLKYASPLPGCDIERVDYFLTAPVSLGKGSDLAVGLDPDYIWLVEEQQ